MTKPIADISPDFCKSLKGIFFDIDDTITLHGKIPAAAFSALWQAHEAGLRLVPVTGRPAGWADHIARMWPVDAVVGENGAFFFHLFPDEGRDGKMYHRFLQDEDTRAKNRQRLHDLYAKLHVTTPQLKLAGDQRYREIDIAIDVCEETDRLSDRAIAEIKEYFEKAGAQAKISSIHVNAWFGNHNKFTTCELLLKEVFQEQMAEEREHYLYFGDSPNDEPFFKGLPNSVGVANIKEFLRLMQHEPTYITQKPGGDGFAEAIQLILKQRQA